MRRVREPAFAGAFYYSSPDALRAQIEGCFVHELGPGEVPEVGAGPWAGPLGVISPHAGYQYSGPTAAWAFRELARAGRPEVAILVGPNHRLPALVNCVEDSGAWRTPLGESPIAEELARKIAEAAPELTIDNHAQSGEHSLEVQVPFLQFVFGTELPIVPIMITDHNPRTCVAIGRALAEVAGPGAAYIASSDMTHFEPAGAAESKDRAALRAVEALEPEELARVVRERAISMCGVAPAMVVMSALRELGAKGGTVLSYTHSGMTTGDNSSVVGYAAVALR